MSRIHADSIVVVVLLLIMAGICVLIWLSTPEERDEDGWLWEDDD